MTQRSIRNALAPGQALSWYKVERILGEGSFGITYLARDANLGRLVAIKEFLPAQFAERAEDDSVRPISEEHEEPFRWGLERFINEAQTLAHFQHPTIVHVYAVFEANGTAYMVMQYEEGRTLQSVLNRHKTLDEAELIALLGPLLDGLEVVHRSGFVHRDIKPDNIILREDGSPVLIDFGSARQSLEQRTQPLTILISPGYTPLEQYSSNPDAQGPWTDIYSLAATLYRCVTGRTPANAIERSDSVRRKNRDSLTPAVEAAKGDYPEPVLAAIDHGLAFSSGERPHSIVEWRDEFGVFGISGKAPPEWRPAWADTKPPADSPDEPPADDGVPTEPSAIHLSKAFGTFNTLRMDTEPATRADNLRAGLQAGAAIIVAIVLGVGLTWMYQGALRTPPAGESGTRQGPSSAAPADGLQPTAEIRRGEEPLSAERLMVLAEEAMSDLRLTIPPGDNAAYYYRRVLDLDPSNARARQGLRDIAREYALLAEEQITASDYAAARGYVERGLEVLPENEQLLRLRADLEALVAAEAEATEAQGEGGDSADGFGEALKNLFSGPRNGENPPPDPR
ncbi:MAG: protein kinase [Gammaproteobacteria bacterium]|nr:protein kinase [Gammaproteobacteria bacterium]